MPELVLSSISRAEKFSVFVGVLLFFMQKTASGMRISVCSADVFSSDLVALIAFGGYMALRHIEQGNRGEQAEALVAALGKANTSQPRAATAALDKIIAEAHGA